MYLCQTNISKQKELCSC